MFPDADPNSVTPKSEKTSISMANLMSRSEASTYLNQILLLENIFLPLYYTAEALKIALLAYIEVFPDRKNSKNCLF